jgi:hypothetical protein
VASAPPASTGQLLLEGGSSFFDDDFTLNNTNSSFFPASASTEIMPTSFDFDLSEHYWAPAPPPCDDDFDCNPMVGVDSSPLEEYLHTPQLVQVQATTLNAH